MGIRLTGDEAWEAMESAYAGTPVALALRATAHAFSAQQEFVRFVPEGRILTWDNARLGLPKP